MIHSKRRALASITAAGLALAIFVPQVQAQQEVDPNTAEACKLAMRAHVMRSERDAQRVTFEANSTRLADRKGSEWRIQGNGTYDIYSGAPRPFSYTCVYDSRYRQVTRVSFDR